MDAGQQTVLIVDDVPEDRVALRRYLTLGFAVPYRVLEADTGAEGLRLWREERPDCVVIDYYLPDQDGLSLLAAMIAHHQGDAIPAVMLTLRGDPALAVKAITAGAQDYLVKDRMSADELRRAVANAIERVRLHYERSHALAALRERETRLRLALEAGSLGAWEWHPASGAVSADERLLMLFGLTPHTFDGTAGPIFAAIVAADRPTVEAALAEAMATGGRYEAEFRVAAADGAMRWLRGVGHAQHDQPGGLRVVGFNEDITPRKAIEQERLALLERERATRSAAEEAVRLRESFLAVASHELKTPLTSLLGNLYMLQRSFIRQGLLAEREERFIRVAEAQGNRLKRTVNAMLDVSQLQVGELQLQWAQLDLAALLRAAVEEERLSLTAHTLTYQAEGEALIVAGDNERLEQLVHALIGNAVKYSPFGGSIAVALRREATHVIMTVSDQGIGMSAELMARLGQPFTRAALDHRQFSGMGVSLYLSGAIVALHGGTFVVTSEEGGGTTVTVTLPAGSADAHAPAAPPATGDQRREAQ